MPVFQSLLSLGVDVGFPAITKIFKVFTIVAAMSLIFSVSTTNALTDLEQEIVDRIQPVGSVCVEGEDCGDIAVVTSTSSSSGPRNGEQVYNSSCFACHATGISGSPKFGDADAWGPRIEQGMDTLLSHALSGFNAMPARGACTNCSDEEIEAAISYMVDQVQ